MTKKFSTGWYLAKSKSIHGDTYDYTKTIYKNAIGRVTITCRKHGDFSIQARKHTNGKQGCSKCSRLISSGKQAKTVVDFIRKSKELYGNKFTYNNSIYTNNKTKLLLTCKEHGDFGILPNNHYKGLGGCKECAKISFLKSITKKLDKFVSESRRLHGAKYSYNKTKYVKNNRKVVLICNIHGDFEITPLSHLRGAGCQKCGYIKISEGVRKSPEYFLKECKIVHGNRYNYDKVRYTHSHSKVTVTCKIHGDFDIAPSNFLAAKGCRKCGLLNNGYNRTKFISRCANSNDGLGNIYIIKCYNDEEVFYKVGISSTVIDKRYNCKKKMPYKYDLVKEIILDPAKAYDIENRILKDLAKYNYKPKIEFKGKTECFSTLEPIIDCLRQYLNVK